MESGVMEGKEGERKRGMGRVMEQHESCQAFLSEAATKHKDQNKGSSVEQALPIGHWASASYMEHPI